MSAYDWPLRGRRPRRDDREARRAFNAARGLFRGGELLTEAPSFAPRAAPSNSTDLWQPVGPLVVLGSNEPGTPRVTGRVHDIAVEPISGQRAYAATGTGGVWYTSNGGASWRALGGWRPADPNAPAVASPMAGGCLFVLWGVTNLVDDPNEDEVFVGTGEGFPDPVGQPGGYLPGIGILHAKAPSTKPETDPVFTAEATNLIGAGVFRITRQGAIVMAATTKGLLERPAAGGATWNATTNLPGASDRVCTDVVWTKPVGTQPGRLWAALRAPNKSMELWWRADGTASFIQAALPSGPGAAAPVTMLALAGSAAGDVVWVLGDGPRVWRVDATVGAPAGVLVNGIPADLWGGDHLNVDKIAIAVDPSNSANVALGGTTKNSGAALFLGAVTSPAAGTFSYPGTMVGNSVHADVMNVAFTNDGQQVWVACDGGVFVSMQAGADMTYVPRNTGLAAVEAGYVACHPENDAAVVIGAQDNATQRRIGESLWRWEQAGDGGGVAFDQVDTHRYVAQYSKADWSNGPDAPGAPVHRKSFKKENDASEFYSTPATIALAATNQLAIGTNRVWYSTDWGANWVTLPNGKVDPRGGAPAAPVDDAQDVLPDAGGPVRVLRWGSATRLWVLCHRALYLMDFNASTGSWKRIDISLEDVLHPAKSTDVAASDQCTDIAVQDPIRGASGSLYLAMNGDLSTSDADSLWWYDGSSEWKKVGLRSQTTAAALAVAVEPGHEDIVYVGTTIGVFRAKLTFTNGEPSWGDWTRLDNGLPDVAVQDLAVFSKGPIRLLRAATQARGVWELDLGGPVTDRTYARVHPYDSRRTLPTPVAAPFEAKVADPADATKQIPVPYSWHCSPDLVVHPRLGPMAAPPSLPWSQANPSGAGAHPDPVAFWQLWRFQTALRALDRRSKPTGGWDNLFEGVMRANGAPVVAGKASLDTPFWQNTVTGLNLSRLPWDTALPTEADLDEYLPARSTPLGIDAPSIAVPKGVLTAYVVVHHRGPTAVAAGSVQATLLYRVVGPWAGTKSTDWLPGPVGWAAPIADLLKNGTAPPPLAGGWKLADAPVRRQSTVDVVAGMPTAIPFDVTLTAPEIKNNALVVLVAVVHSPSDPVTISDVPLQQLTLASPHVAVRSIQIAV